MNSGQKTTRPKLKTSHSKEKLLRMFTMTPAYDKRHTDPSKNYGIASMHMIFAVVGVKGAMTCTIGTNIFLPEIIQEYRTIGVPGVGKVELLNDKQLETWSVDAHKRVKISSENDRCDWLDGDGCIRNGSSYRADRDKIDDILLRKGSEGIYEYLENAYRTWGWL